jgi:hypothetical protein
MSEPRRESSVAVLFGEQIVILQMTVALQRVTDLSIEHGKGDLAALRTALLFIGSIERSARWFHGGCNMAPMRSVISLGAFVVSAMIFSNVSADAGRKVTCVCATSAKKSRSFRTA